MSRVFGVGRLFGVGWGSAERPHRRICGILKNHKKRTKT